MATRKRLALFLDASPVSLDRLGLGPRSRLFLAEDSDRLRARSLLAIGAWRSQSVSPVGRWPSTFLVYRKTSKSFLATLLTSVPRSAAR